MPTTTADSRFDTKAWEQQAQASGSGNKARAEPAAAASADEGEEDDDDAASQDDGEEEGTDAGSGSEAGDAKTVKPLTQAELEAFERKERKKGIVYISRIPPGMTPPKVRHLLSGFGDVERVYLQDGSKGKGEAPKRKSTSAFFTEGWVEFTSKRAARATAELLNAQPIGAAMGGFGGGGGGGKKGGGAQKNARRWRDEVWTMRYLRGFKWGALSTQLANERASHASRLRAELTQSAHENKDYLAKVERARVMRDKEARAAARRASAPTSSTTTDAAGGAGSSAPAAAPATQQGKVHTFKQRAPVHSDVRDARKAKRGSEGGAAEEEAAVKRRKADKPRAEGEERAKKTLEGVMGKIF